jgi:predicted nucleic acid-binding protein
VIAFLDANALIYLLEGDASFASRVRKTLAQLNQTYPLTDTAVSRLTSLECRVGPMKSGNSSLLKQYDDFFAQPNLLWIEITREVVELATEIRASTGLKTPDCLQAACCLQLGEDHQFLTGDTAFKRVHGLNVLGLK